MSLVYAQMGMQAVGSLSAYYSASASAKLASMTQAYNNRMQEISLTQSLNAQTENEIAVRDAAVRAQESIQVQSMQDQATLAVGAAAAGVTGGSVASAMRGLERGKLRAQAALAAKMESQARSDLSTRRNLLMGAAFGRDTSVISQPSVASAMLGLGASLIDTWDSHQPEGTRIADRLAVRR